MDIEVAPMLAALRRSLSKHLPNTTQWPNLDDLELDLDAERKTPEECERLRPNGSALWLAQNGTCLEHAPELTYGTAVKAAVLSVMAALSLVGNAATIASIRRNRNEKRSCHQTWSAVYTLILHLSVADLLVTVFCLGGEAIWSYTVAWLAGNVVCKLFKFMQMFSLYLSTFVLVLIGVDRFVVVKYPMKSLNTNRRLVRLILFIWILSFLLSIPQLFIFRVVRGPFLEDFYQCVTYGFYTEPWQEQLYTTFSLVCMFLLPLVILISTYVSTIIAISRSEMMFKTEVATGGKFVASEVNRRRIIHRAKMKSLRISVVIVIAFIVCWTPYYTMMIIFMFLDPDEHLSEDLRSGIFFFGMSNSLVNPLIYGAFHLWSPRKDRYDSRYRETSLAHRSLADRGGSTRVVLNRHSCGDEETTVVLLEHAQDRNNGTRRLATKFLQHYKGVLGTASNVSLPQQTHI